MRDALNFIEKLERTMRCFGFHHWMSISHTTMLLSTLATTSTVSTIQLRNLQHREFQRILIASRTFGMVEDHRAAGPLQARSTGNLSVFAS